MEDIKQTALSIVDTNKRIELPEIVEITGSTRNYVYFGRDNNFPAFVEGLYNECSTLRSIIDGTAEYIQGNGVLNSPKWATVNTRGTTIEDFVLQIATDYMKYDGFAIQVIYSKAGDICELYALDFKKVRLSADSKKAYYAKTWGTYTSKYEEFDTFDRGKIDPKKKTQIFYYKAAHRTIYPYPKWQGAFRDCLAEIESSKYTLNSLHNGLAVRTLITIPNPDGQLTAEEKKEVEKGIKAKFTGPEADSSFMIYWNEDAMRDVKIDSIKDENETDRFNAIKKSARENIFIAFRAVPALFGLMTESKGFSKEEFSQAFELYNKTVVNPKQKKIVDVLQLLTGDKTIQIIPFKLETEE